MSRINSYPDGYILQPGDRIVVSRQGRTLSVTGAGVTAGATPAEQFDDYKRYNDARVQALTEQNSRLIALVEAATGNPLPSLNALYLSSTAFTAGTMFNATIAGATPGSTITATADDGTTLNVTGELLSGTFTTAGSKTITLTEALAGYFNSPNQNQIVVAVADAGTVTPTPTPSLNALTVSPSSATVGTAYSGTITGLTSGSSIALSGAGSAGLSIAGGVITGTPTTAGAVDIIETLAGATGSPRTSSAVVTVAASSSATFSRMATTQAADTSNNTALISALAANNARPSYTLAANTPRTIAWKIGAVADPGAFIAYIVDKSGYTAVAEQSFDSTNNVDGTWSRLTDAIVFPSGGTSSQGAANTRQIAMVPAGPARWIRLTLTHTASANVYYPAVYQRPTSGLSNVWLGVGASLEGYGMWSKDMEDAIVAAYPAQDPVFLRYAVGGTTVSTIKNSPAEVAATHWANLFSYVIVGNAIGNDITANQPISGTSQTTINTIRTNYDTLLTAFPGKIVFPVRTTYRAYSGVTPTAQDGGSLPFNIQIVDPSVATNQSSAYDSSLSIPRVDLYSAALLNRGSLNSGDPVHYSTYVWYQAELVRTAVRFAYTGAWPASFIETQVAKAESTTLTADINEAQYSVNSLVAGSAKTAFQNRLNALSGAANLVISGTPAAATQGVAYSYTPTTTGGTAPITFARTGTALPAGLSFNTATGAITGTPTTVANTTGIIITATDSSNPVKTASQTIAINVAAAGSFLINDTFTTASDMDLSGHTPETGGAWTPSTASTVFVSAATGRGRKGVSTAGIYATYLNATAPTATNYDIDLDVQFPTVFSFFVVLRAMSDANNVFAGYSTTNGWTLGTRLSSTNTTVNNTAFTAPAGSTSYHLKIQVRGDVMTLLVDGVSKATGTITAKPGTLVGVEYPTTSFAGSDTVGPQFDNLRVTENPA